MNKIIYQNISDDFYSNGVYIPRHSKLSLLGMYLSVNHSSYVDFITSNGFKITLKGDVVRKKLKRLW